MPRKPTSDIDSQIASLVEQCRETVDAIPRKIVAGESTAADRTRRAAIEQKIATLRAEAEAIKDKSERQTAVKIAAFASSLAKHSVRLIEDRLLALAPPENPR